MVADGLDNEPSPLQTCQEVNVWSLLFFGVLLPVTIQGHMAALRHRRDRWPVESLGSLALASGVQLLMGSALLWICVTTVLLWVLPTPS